MTPTQKAAMQAAIKALEAHSIWESPDDPQRPMLEAIKLLEAALEEPEQEPYIYYADGETYTPDAVAEIFADLSGLTPLYTHPANVPLLTNEEISKALPWSGYEDFIEYHNAHQVKAACRAIESAVRKKAGLG